MTYLPQLSGSFTPADRETIQTNIAIHHLTHVRTRTGDVWRVRTPLNEKSVPLNDASAPPSKTRVTYEQVESFGITQKQAESALDDVVKDLTDSGVTITISPSSHRALGEVTQAVANSVERVTGASPIETPAAGQATVAQHEKVAPTQQVNDSESPNSSPQHGGRAHAILSASGASRWLNCPPSARLEEHHPNTTSDAADQGTAAHELAEHKLRQLQNLPTTRPESPWHDEEMDDYTDAYADCVMAELEAAKQNSPAAFLSIEERLDFSHIVPDGFGTGDAVIIADDTAIIIDLKYGKGVEVSAVENPQMKLYALGALHLYGMIYNIQKIKMVIFQPRRNNTSIFETTVTDLLTWAETVVKPTAQLAMAGEGQLTAGSWCGFCKHAPQCTALAAQHFQAIPTTSATSLEPTAPAPDTLTDQQIAQVIEHSAAIKKWLTSVEKHALTQAHNGHNYPGLKLVEGRSVRKWKDEHKVAEIAEAHGIDPWQKKLIGITDMTKLMGKKEFTEQLGGCLIKPEGAPTLVPESDPRPALTPDNAETYFVAIEAA